MVQDKHMKTRIWLHYSMGKYAFVISHRLNAYGFINAYMCVCAWAYVDMIADAYQGAWCCKISKSCFQLAA